jgi:hypothetical protein
MRLRRPRSSLVCSPHFLLRDPVMASSSVICLKLRVPLRYNHASHVSLASRPGAAGRRRSIGNPHKCSLPRGIRKDPRLHLRSVHANHGPLCPVACFLPPLYAGGKKGTNGSLGRTPRASLSSGVTHLSGCGSDRYGEDNLTSRSTPLEIRTVEKATKRTAQGRPWDRIGKCKGALAALVGIISGDDAKAFDGASLRRILYRVLKAAGRPLRVLLDPRNAYRDWGRGTSSWRRFRSELLGGGHASGTWRRRRSVGRSSRSRIFSASCETLIRYFTIRVRVCIRRAA